MCIRDRVQIEGTFGLGLPFHYLEGLVGQAIRQVLSLLAWFEPWDVSPVAKIGIAVEWVPKGLRGAPRRATDVEVEAVGLWVGLRPSDVPLAEVGPPP